MSRYRTLGQVFISAGLVACGTSTADVESAPDVKADLRADSNRDGTVKFDDESDAKKDVWDKSNGAVFLANIDDDTMRCKATGDDVTMALCNDADDDVVNGDDDALDLARIKSRPWPKTPADATGHIDILTAAAKDKIRLFKKTGPGASDFEVLADDNSLTSAEIKAGIELAIEGKDIVRDSDAWDGKVEIQLTVTSATKGSSTDKVILRIAPVLTYHHLLPAEKIWVANLSRDAGNAAMRSDLAKTCTAAGLPAPEEIQTDDPWAQDYFEPAFMSMPGDGGAQHVIRVHYRSANVQQPDTPKSPLRQAGQVVWKLRGKDVAGIQQYDINHDPNMDSLNSFGNLETVPPYDKDGVSYPFGRVIRGSVTALHPDPTFAKMIHSQGQQPEIFVDTSWLLVGHIDETTSWLKTSSPRGWTMIVNDARAAKQMLEDQVTAGKGDTTMFVGKVWVDDNNKESPAEISIKNVLADTVVMGASAEAASEVDGQITIIKNETGLTDDEIIHIPFLHTTIDGKSAAYSPGVVNGVYVSDTHFGAPDPHGPVVDGKDLFKTAISDPLQKIGITVDFIEDWDTYHLGIGEVHCGSNSTRKIPDAKWWESGR